MPLLSRLHRLPAVALAGGAALTLGMGTGVAVARPATSPRHHHHVTLASHHHSTRAHRTARAKHHPKKKTTTTPPVTTTPTTTTPPVTTTPSVPTTPVAIPTTPPAPTVSTTSTTTSSTPDAGQILFQNSYPASGNALNLAGTGWNAVQYPSDSGVPQPNRVQFGPAPGSSTDPNLPTTNVAHFQLQPYSSGNGDVTNAGGSASRVEVYGRYGGSLPAASWPDPVGSIRWYSYSVYIPTGFPTRTVSSEWFDFTQWKGLNSGSPPVAMEIRGTNFVLGGANSSQTLGSIDPGTWTHFVVGLDFSDSATTGWATVFVNGALVVNQVPTQTMNDATVNGVTGVDPDYLKMGIYRSTTWNVSQDLYLTPMTIGTTLGSVS